MVDLLDKLIELLCKQQWWEQTDGRTDTGENNNPSAEKTEG